MSRRSLLATCAAVVAACGGSSTTPSAPAPAPALAPGPDAQLASPAPAPAPAPASPGTTVVTPAGGDTLALRSAGKGDKARLAFAFHAGDHRKMKLVVGVVADMGGGKTVQPTITFELDGEVLTVDDHGTAHVRMTVASVDVAAGGASSVAGLHAMVGATDELDVSANGERGAQTVTLPDGAAMASISPFLSIGIGLPPDPVGDGASWAVTHATVTSGIHADATDVYQLVSRSNGIAQLATTMSMTAPAQAIQQGGRTIDVKRFASTETGTMTLDPSTFWIAQTSESKTSMDVEVDGNTASVVVTTTTTSTLE